MSVLIKVLFKFLDGMFLVKYFYMFIIGLVEKLNFVI